MKGKKIKEYSEKEGNLEIMKSPTKSMGKSIVVGTMNVLTKERKVLGRGKKTRKTTNTIFIILAAIALFIWTSYSINNYLVSKNIELEIRSVNEVITSGSVETFEIEYRNNSDENIHHTNLTIDFPDNFTITNVIPRNIFDNNTNTFNLGDLNSGANGKVKVSGLISGEINTQEVVNASLNYVYQSMDKRIPDSFIYLIEKSVLTLGTSFPKEVYKDINFSSRIVVKNNGNNKLDNIKIALDGVTLLNVNSATDIQTKDNYITLESIKPGEKVILDIESLVNQESESKLTTSLFSNGFKQAEQENNIVVKVPNFIVSITPDKTAIVANEVINFKFNYENKESDTISNVKFNIEANGGFNISSLNSENRGIEKEGNILTITKDLEKNEKGEFNIGVRMNRKTMEMNQQTYLIVNVSYNINGKQLEYPINSQKIKILSNLNVSAKGNYYSSHGDQLGTGPIPPMANLPTNYWIFLEANNFGNKLTNFSVTADLPEGLVWTNNKSILDGNLQYGEIGRRVIWNINELTAENKSYKVGFEVGLMPEDKDVGKVLDLLSNIRYYAHDSFGDKELSGIKEDIDTNLKYDNLVSGKGTVQEFK